MLSKSFTLFNMLMQHKSLNDIMLVLCDGCIVETKAIKIVGGYNIMAAKKATDLYSLNKTV